MSRSSVMSAAFTAAQAAQKWKIGELGAQEGFTAAQAAQKPVARSWRFACRVHCRTGSSENHLQPDQLIVVVHCRTGSSENTEVGPTSDQRVHCRTGSSEKAGMRHR